MKLKLPVFASILLFGINVCFGEHFTIDIGTTVPGVWTVSSGSISNVAPFVYYDNPYGVYGLSVTSTGNGNGYYLLGANLSTFDGFWTAKTGFYLPPAASNIVLNYSYLGYDDAGVLFLNETAIAATATTATSTNTVSGQFVFLDGAARQPWSFMGPESLAAGIVTDGFIPGGVNALTSTINNTGGGPDGNLTGLSYFDYTSFTVEATVSYDLTPVEGAIAISLFPGIQINGTTGAAYQLQYRTNLAGGNWTTLANIPLPGSPYLFFDTDPITSDISRYYRTASLAENVVLNLGTAEPDAWKVSAGGISNVPPFVYYNSRGNGLSVTSTGDGSGYFLLGTNLTNFDGFWTAEAPFYLPPAATDIVLNYSGLGFDDAGVFFLNGVPISATDTTASSADVTSGQFVFADGTTSRAWSFTGPEYQVSRTVTGGFIPGGRNTLSATINNTIGGGASGHLQNVSGGDYTIFSVSAAVSYNLNPVAGSLAIELDPGLQISGTIGGIYQLQSTTNVAVGNWTALTNIVLPSSPYLYFDTDAITNHLSRSYRVVAQ